ncbi:phosphonate C-P lyase system protein PhnH [Variovorax sp. PAMC 28711]|uniref:phosphonate C-P lyase system protein PhnH n=1 Tax=Variovorax sp. PAMC 28711 TaxID=1795631 RepID=UPI00078D77D6|nr:phosphonate C-P lyase system protein PhnH [Variovorax sp. PAMC 28711]AMM23981.1 phosphonate C-P lyase system protein PhnH [Variovorax sp. PAMC 28711]
MSAARLSTLGAGFSDASMGSQAVFRAALQALSHPGRIVDLPHDAQVPSHGHAASAALLLALLDPDCRLWLSPSLAGTDAAPWLRFHTGCVLVDAPAEAQFAWIASGDATPPLEAFAQGSDTYPDQSTTCVVDVAALTANPAGGWTLSGPGIQSSAHLAVEGCDADNFVAQWRANHAAFPRGVDVYLATPRQIVGLPRSTRIEQEA